MNLYKVKPRHSVVLGEGVVFMTDPKNVAGALQVGAVEEVQDPNLNASPDVQSPIPEATKDVSEAVQDVPEDK